MTVTTERDGNVLTMQMNGDISGFEAEQWGSLVEIELDEDVEKVILDCSGMKYISSAGLRVLLKIQKKMDLNDGELIVKNVAPTVMDILNVVGFADFLTIE